MHIARGDTQRTIKCAVREKVLVRLPGNPSTGYAWRSVSRTTGNRIADDTTLVLAQRFKPFEGVPRGENAHGRVTVSGRGATISSSVLRHSARLGAVGVYEFEITPLVAGTHTVNLVYAQPWNAEVRLVDPEDRFTVVLKVTG